MALNNESYQSTNYKISRMSYCMFQCSNTTCYNYTTTQPHTHVTCYDAFVPSIACCGNKLPVFHCTNDNDWI